MDVIFVLVGSWGSEVALAKYSRETPQETRRAQTFYCIEVKVPVVCSVTAVVPLRVDGH